jgi:hypothetical protein
MARAAIERASGHVSSSICLKNIIWARPIIVNDPVQLHIGLFAEEENIQFEIYLLPENDEPIVYCQGSAVFVEHHSTTIDIQSLINDCHQHLKASACYEIFKLE